MTHDTIAAYLDDLARALRAPGAYSRDLVDEVRDHLLDSVEAAQRPFGSLALAIVGGMTRYDAVTRDFEGYAVVLGTLFSLQAVLTLLHLPWRTPSSSGVA